MVVDDDGIDVGHAAVADFDVVAVEKFMVFVLFREMLVLKQVQEIFTNVVETLFGKDGLNQIIVVAFCVLLVVVVGESFIDSFVRLIRQRVTSHFL